MGKSMKRRNKTCAQDDADRSAGAKSEISGITGDVDKHITFVTDEASTWKTIRSHPTFLAFIFVVIPWIVSKQANRIYFQYPHHMNRVLDILEQKGIYRASYRLRPALTMKDPRQLLIVGSMSSGTSQVAHDLSESLDLEMGHEDSDTLQFPVRDGTVSWFHGLRYLHRDSKERARITVEFCNVAWRIYSSDKINPFHPWSNFGTELIIWGPTSYSLPVFRPSFQTAYLQTCQETIFREIGCGMNDNCQFGTLPTNTAANTAAMADSHQFGDKVLQWRKNRSPEVAATALSITIS